MIELYEQKSARQWPPPCPLSEAPTSLRERFADHGLQLGKSWCWAQRYEGAHVMNWSSSYIDSYCEEISVSGSGSYSRDVVELLLSTLQSLKLNQEIDRLGVRGAVGLVMGTEHPWVECLLLNEGASLVWTFEYATINVQHTRMKAKQCQLIAKDYLEGQFDPVDIIVSYSSLEHSGLGRYGDSLNPDADKEALAQAWCMLRPGGLLVLGVPMSCTDEGSLEFNAHRIYGFERLAYVSENFLLEGFALDSCPNSNRDSIVIFRKPTDLNLKNSPVLMQIMAGAFTEETFRSNMDAMCALDTRLVIVTGWFRDTCQNSSVKRIAFLRLDGDLFQSTWDVLISLYERVIPGGNEYVDYYVAFPGCMLAVNNFRTFHGITEPLCQVKENDPFDAWQQTAFRIESCVLPKTGIISWSIIV